MSNYSIIKNEAKMFTKPNKTYDGKAYFSRSNNYKAFPSNKLASRDQLEQQLAVNETTSRSVREFKIAVTTQNNQLDVKLKQCVFPSVTWHVYL